MGTYSLLSWAFFFLPSIVALGLRESWRSMWGGEREQRDSSPKAVRQVTVKGMWVSQDGNLSMGNWLCPWEHIISEPVQVVAWWQTQGACRDLTLSSPLFWLRDWRADPELSLPPQPLPSGVPCGSLTHSDTFPLAADDTRERLQHPGGDSAQLRKHDAGQPANCCSTGQNTLCPCSPAGPPLTPERQAPLGGSGDHWICRSILKGSCAGRSVPLCLCANVGWQVQGPWGCRSMLAARMRAVCGPLVCVPHVRAQVPLNKMGSELSGTKRIWLPAIDGPG